MRTAWLSEAEREADGADAPEGEKKIVPAWSMISPFSSSSTRPRMQPTKRPLGKGPCQLEENREFWSRTSTREIRGSMAKARFRMSSGVMEMSAGTGPSDAQPASGVYAQSTWSKEKTSE